MLFFLILVTVTFGSPLHALFSSFQLKYNKTYATESDQYIRYRIFKHNLKMIEQHNANPANTFKLRMNKHGDVSNEEFSAKLAASYDHDWIKKRLVVPDNTSEPVLNSRWGRRVPMAVDWANPSLSVSTGVRDQLECGGCWAFAVADALESRVAIKHKTNAVKLSVQELIDCSTEGVNDGCTGGNLPEGYDYILHQRGLCTARSYPFRGRRQRCHSNCDHSHGKIRDYGIVHPNDEALLKEAVAKGPVAIAITGDTLQMQFYGGGIFSSRSCGTGVNHAMVIYGYGTDRGQKYWKVKNSWSDDWGEGGFVRVCRECGRNGRAGECGVTLEPVFPIV